MPTKLYIGPAGAKLEELKPLAVEVTTFNFSLEDEEGEPAERRDFGCRELPELTFTLECRECPPLLKQPWTKHTSSHPGDNRPRTYEATLPADSIVVPGLRGGSKAVVVHADLIHLAKKRQYRGCNKSKFYNRNFKRRKR